MIAGFRYLGGERQDRLQSQTGTDRTARQRRDIRGHRQRVRLRNIWNGIGGFRGRVRIGNTGLFVPYYFDIGAGGSKLTWQIASGLGYQTGWAGVSVTYRYLSFQQASSTVVQHLWIGGPMIMANFSF